MIKKVFKSRIISIFIILIGLFSCSKNDEITIRENTSLEDYLKANADYVQNINGFYIVASATNPTLNETTPGTTGREIFEHSVRLFSSFLDQNNDGVIDTDKVALSEHLANKMLFVSGPLNMVNQISEANQVISKGLYAMSMQTDNWPYIRDYNGTGWTIDKLDSSTWRPQVFNALWEEVFHTVTEAYSRVDYEFRFTTGGDLRTHMDNDIIAGTYDISEQNALEGGNYDRVTAVNEYIHQIWAINFAGLSNKLNSHQQSALNFMINKNVPMSVNANYTQMLGTRVK